MAGFQRRWGHLRERVLGKVGDGGLRHRRRPSVHSGQSPPGRTIWVRNAYSSVLPRDTHISQNDMLAVCQKENIYCAIDSPSIATLAVWYKHGSHLVLADTGRWSTAPLCRDLYV